MVRKRLIEAVLDIILVESSNCQEGDVRLVNGSFTTEGRVEVCSNGIWGSICSTKFTAIDAYVICKELGYGLIGEKSLVLSGGDIIVLL